MMFLLKEIRSAVSSDPALLYDRVVGGGHA